ncbi:MAG: HNH endonuclease [Candidatus Margulisbacteria bacterium]|nr:HNH endonuclease [Candidatus Margulisiibacteriota bacterium]
MVNLIGTRDYLIIFPSPWHPAPGTSHAPSRPPLTPKDEGGRIFNRETTMINPHIKTLLGFDPTTDDKTVKKQWDKRIKNICKPCWELRYCPYGPLVEEFPLLGPTKDEAIEHNEFLVAQLKKGAYKGNIKTILKKEVREFNPDNYPTKHSKQDIEKACSVFGHLCPVYFVNEPFTETKELRRIGRLIPRTVMLRVVRRDNNQCQLCGRVLMDNEIEFDHIIPLSKGGSSEENNIRVTCLECNRSKSDKTTF